MVRNSQRFRSVVYIYYPFPMNGTIQESRIIPSIIIVPKTILRTKIARAIQTPAYYHNNQRNTSPRNERRKKIFQKKKYHSNISITKGRQHSFTDIHRHFFIPTNTQNAQKRCAKLLKIFLVKEILFRRRRKAGTFTDSRQPQRNSIDRETRVYIFRGELNCSQNALVTETSENLVQWFLAVCDRWRG